MLDAADHLPRLAAGYREMRRMPPESDKQRIGWPERYARRLPLSTAFRKSFEKQSAAREMSYILRELSGR